MDCQIWKENLALHKGCQKRQNLLGKVAIFGNFCFQKLPKMATLVFKSCHFWQLLKTPKLPKMASEHSSIRLVSACELALPPSGICMGLKLPMYMTLCECVHLCVPTDMSQTKQ